MATDQGLYDELAFYTLAHRDPAFLHQHIVDAFAAQHAQESPKPLGVGFALIGLYLHVEKGFTGRQVQRAHMQMGRWKKEWPRLPVPAQRGTITVADVVAAQPGEARDAMIHRWCRSVWEAWKESHGQVAEIAKSELGA